MTPNIDFEKEKKSIDPEEIHQGRKAADHVRKVKKHAAQVLSKIGCIGLGRAPDCFPS